MEENATETLATAETPAAVESLKEIPAPTDIQAATEILAPTEIQGPTEIEAPTETLIIEIDETDTETQRKDGLHIENIVDSPPPGSATDGEASGGETAGGEASVGETEAGDGTRGSIVGLELSVSEINRLERERRQKKREEKKKQRELYSKAMDKLHPEPVSETVDKSPKKSSQKVSILKKPRSIEDEEEQMRAKSSMLLSGTYDRELMEELAQRVSDTMSSSSDEADHGRRHCSVSFKGHFLMNFQLPSFSDISTESSEEYVPQKSTIHESIERSSTLDVGRFVDPLTGETQSSSSGSNSREKQEEGEEEEEESSKSISFDWPFDLHDAVVPEAEPIDDAEMAMEMLYEIHSSFREIRRESTSAMEQERAEREIRQIVIDVLFKLFDEAVDAGEYVNPDTVLSLKMDKSKIIKELNSTISEHLSVKQYNTDLVKKMHDYYRRTGQLRTFDELPHEINVLEHRRYLEAMLQLDHMKEKAKQTKIKNNTLLSSVKLDMDYASSIAQQSDIALEKFIRDTILRKDVEFLPRIVDRELRVMQQVRNEISDCRLWLITRQHTLGRLDERKRHFDQITDELTMDEFLVMQREVSALGTKVEERNTELNRMRDRWTKHVHHIAFIREKTSMNTQKLYENKIDLANKIKRQGQLRDRLLQLKLTHARLKTQKTELQHKGQLLHKPALLHDYDKTVEFIDRKRERVKHLRNTVLDLESRIEKFEIMARTSIALRSPTPSVSKQSLKNN